MSMDPGFELTLRILAIGAGATIVMDLWLALLRWAGLPAASFVLLGRWLAYLSRGTWLRGGPAKAAPIRGEGVLGWAAHYVVGVAFAAILVVVMGLEWARAPTLVPALLAGIVSVIAPLFVMQPAMGAGIASAKTKTPLLNNLRSLANHTVFGVGLYVAALGSAHLVASRIAPHL